MTPAKVLYLHPREQTSDSLTPSNLSRQIESNANVSELDLAETMAFPFQGLELRAFLELRQLSHATQRATGSEFCVLSVADLRRLFTPVDSKPPSGRWVFCVMRFLLAVGVVELRAKPGQSNAWRIQPATEWAAPEEWAALRQPIYSNPKPKPRSRPRPASTNLTTMDNVVFDSRLTGLTGPNDDFDDAAEREDDPLQGQAARTYYQVFQRQPTLHFAATYLNQITEAVDHSIWRKVLIFYRARYQSGNRAPRPDTLWKMFLDWRENPHRVIDMPEPVLNPLKAPAGQPQSKQGEQHEYNANAREQAGKRNRNADAAADTLDLFQ